MPNLPSDLKSFLATVRAGDFVVLDTETTGLKSPAEIIDLAIIDSKGDPLFNRLIKPQLDIPELITNLTGITFEMVQDEPTWTDVLPTLKEILQGKLIVTYNAKFDRYMFHCSDEMNGIKHFSWDGYSQWLCAMEAYAERNGESVSYGGYRWKKLSEAAAFYGIAVRDSHRALADAQTTLDLVKMMWSETVLNESFNSNTTPDDFYGTEDYNN